MRSFLTINHQDIVSLKVNGFKFTGWKGIAISSSIEALSGAFTLDIVFGVNDDKLLAVEAGDSCIVSIGNTAMVTGYVDKVTENITTTEHSVTVSGRDKTGDLVDCSAQPREWAGITFEKIAREITKPFGIEVKTNLRFKQTLPKKSIKTGETAHSVLEKMAKIAGVMLISDRLGGLLMTKAGDAGRCFDNFELGKNIKTISIDKDASEIYSEITVKGQTHGAKQTNQLGIYQLSGAEKNQTSLSKSTVTRKPSAFSASAISGANRFRPLIIAAENQAEVGRCKTRAQYEVGIREAKSKTISIQVQGWRQSNGEIWQINQLAKIIAPSVTYDDFLIVSCDYLIDLNGGTITNIVLRSPKAYELIPEIPNIENKKLGKSKTSKKPQNTRLSGVER